MGLSFNLKGPCTIGDLIYHSLQGWSIFRKKVNAIFCFSIQFLQWCFKNKTFMLLFGKMEISFLIFWYCKCLWKQVIHWYSLFYVLYTRRLAGSRCDKESSVTGQVCAQSSTPLKLKNANAVNFLNSHHFFKIWWGVKIILTMTWSETVWFSICFFTYCFNIFHDDCSHDLGTWSNVKCHSCYIFLFCRQAMKMSRLFFCLILASPDTK